MMMIPPSDFQQDTIKVSQAPLNDSLNLNLDSLPVVTVSWPTIKDVKKFAPVLSAVRHDTIHIDTTLSCKRNSIADVTFYDSINFISDMKSSGGNNFLYSFIEKNKIKKAEEKAILLEQLNEGENISSPEVNQDWIIVTMLFIAFLFSLVRGISKVTKSSVRFFDFRSANEILSHDTGGFFQWQPTLLNFISFLVLSIFSFQVAAFYDFIPAGLNGLVFCLISLAIIILAFTIRNAICLITGNLSGQTEVFHEYLINIHKSYRYSGMALFIIILLISFTLIFNLKTLLIAGIAVVVLMYLIRIIKLLAIFINRNISIFYLILYLCALEILPFLIIIRYFKGD